MNWKEALHTDLGTLMRGGKPPHKASGRKPWTGPQYIPSMLLIFFPVAYPIAWWAQALLFFRRRHVIHVLSVIEGMVRCNAPLPDGLREASLDAPNRRVASILLAVADDLIEGKTLSEAVRPRTRFFPPGTAEMIALAERGGNLADALDGLVRELEEVEAQSERWRDWTVYYVVYGWAALNAAWFVITYVLPEFSVMFADFGVPWPPPPFQEHLAPDNVATIIAGLLTAAILVYFAVTMYSGLRKHPKSLASWRVATAFRALPYLRILFFKQNLAIASGLIGEALGTGAGLDEALDEAAEAPIHPYFKRRLRALSAHITQGATLSEAIDRVGGLPKSFAGLVRLGERSGLLPNAFERIAAIYRSDARKMKLVLLETVAPLGVFAVGTLVLTVSGTLFVTLSILADTLGQPI